MSSRKNSLSERERSPSFSSDVATIHMIAKSEAASGCFETDLINGAELMRLHALDLARAEAAMGNSGTEDEPINYQDYKDIYITTIPEEEALSPNEFGPPISSPLSRSRVKSRSNTLYSIAMYEATTEAASVDSDFIKASELMELHEKALAAEALARAEALANSAVPEEPLNN